MVSSRVTGCESAHRRAAVRSPKAESLWKALIVTTACEPLPGTKVDLNVQSLLHGVPRILIDVRTKARTQRASAIAVFANALVADSPGYRNNTA